MTDIPCRLCEGRAWPLHTLTFLGQLEVQLYRCSRCESVETEPPYWLDISYDRELISFGNDISVRATSMEAWVVLPYVRRHRRKRWRIATRIARQAALLQP